MSEVIGIGADAENNKRADRGGRSSIRASDEILDRRLELTNKDLSSTVLHISSLVVVPSWHSGDLSKT